MCVIFFLISMFSRWNEKKKILVLKYVERSGDSVFSDFFDLEKLDTEDTADDANISLTAHQ